ncbi:MAG: cytochrome c [Gammaproteobacteria bacterium]|jgi:cytochrome c
MTTLVSFDHLLTNLYNLQMKQIIKLLMAMVLLTLLTQCTKKSNNSTTNTVTAVDHFDVDRPHNPWVSRSVLDAKPRMITLALHEDVWAAYHTETGALYKVWKGFVNFDGAVYTTFHGPQPTSLGNAWFINKHEQPWRTLSGGKESKPSVQYKGHRFSDGKVMLTYELQIGNGKTITITEQPEFTMTKGGLAGFERIFTTTNVPEGVQVVLLTNASSLATKEKISTDGKLEIGKTEEVTLGKLSGVAVDGRLTLNNNGTTFLRTTFVKNPLIENPNKMNEDGEDTEVPKGFRLIAKNDCKSCHNTYKKTIGPAYQDVARKYRATEDNVAMLTQKVIKGGTGIWGSQIMNAHPDVPAADVLEMVTYILSLDADEEAKTAAEPEKVFTAKDYIAAAKPLDTDGFYPGTLTKIFTNRKGTSTVKQVMNMTKPSHYGVWPIVHSDGTDMTGLQANFAMLINGYIKVPEDKVYQFRLISDDGSAFYLNGKEAINNDGFHGSDAVDGYLALKAGFHAFTIPYFQGEGGKYISLQWRPKGTSLFEKVSRASLYHLREEQEDIVAASIPMAVARKIPGNGYSLLGVHPSYDLSQARPNDFLPKVGGMDFLSDGRMVVSTWDPAGSVFILDGVQSGDPEKITVKTIAKGFAEPLGVKVVDDEIYVMQKQEMTKLIDYNGDDIADEYQTVSNKWGVSGNFHEFGFGLAYKDDHFYATLATAINPGGASTQPQIQDRGRVVKVSRKDGSTELIGSGLRTPNGVGLGLDDEIFVADNQGDWLPASKIVHVKKDAWYGSRSVDFEGTANKKETLPVVWLPQDEIGNSPSMPLAINDGPYKGQMIHGEVTHGGVKRVFVEKINGEYQGCVFRFIQGLEAGVNRMVWGPDGALYVGGIGNPGNWLQNGKLWYGLQRLKYNGNPVMEMLAIRAKSNGVEIEFTEPLREGEGWDEKNYLIKQWYYKPTEDYGGPKKDLKNLSILSVNISNDRKKVFLELDGMKEGHVVYVKLQSPFISDKGTQIWATEAWYTLNQIPAGQAGIKTAAPAKVEHNELTAAEKAAGYELLFNGEDMTGWRNFRKQTVGESWIIEDGAIHLNAVPREDGGWQVKDGGDIMTDKPYENYIYEMEWKISNCGNSGIIYNVVESEDYDYVWQTGPEMQILDNTCHPDSRFPTHRAGDLYDMIECKYVTVKPAGEWNKVRIVNNKGQVEHWLNGYKVVEFEMGNDKWNEMIAKSKFKEMKGFGQKLGGHISLQDHGDKVWFRNIKIKEL